MIKSDKIHGDCKVPTENDAFNSEISYFLQFFLTFGILNFYILFSPLFECYVWRRFKRSGLKTKEGREDRKLIRFGNGAQRLQLSVSDVDLVN